MRTTRSFGEAVFDLLQAIQDTPEARWINRALVYMLDGMTLAVDTFRKWIQR